MTPDRPQALLFDFDGLICDTERAARRSWDELYTRHGLEFPPGLWAAMSGRPTGEALAARDLGERLGRELTPHELRERRAAKSRLAAAEPLRPGVAALLAEATGAGIPCAVVSSADAHWVRTHLARLDVLDRFADLVTGERAAAHKPAPDLYLTALSAMGVTAARALAFEDSAVGVAAAVAAGIACVAVPNGADDPPPLTGAAAVLASLEDFTLRRPIRAPAPVTTPDTTKGEPR
ncbi:HAD family hydrolase [Kitasatospora sp. NPDC001660]